MFDFTKTSMQEIISILKTLDRDKFSIKVLNPNLGKSLYAGEMIDIDGEFFAHHSLKSWINLAEVLGFRLNMPKQIDKHFISIEFERLRDKSFHNTKSDTEKYGINSEFARVNKLEEPSFLWHYLHSLHSAKIEDKNRILNIGINRGDEFLAIKNSLKDDFLNKEFVGIDYSKSAIKVAKESLNYPNVKLFCEDINNLDSLNLGKFDLLISIGTLQSTNINAKTLVMNLVQNYLKQNSAIIFGFPNGRWIDGELVYSAKAPNYKYPEISLVIKDIYWIKKYLQQHKFRVTITGKEYLFLTATKIGSTFE